MKVINPQKCVVFFDFDNTISTFDVFDNMLPRFSRDDLWKKLENEWQKGKIGSRACLEGQIKGMRITKDNLDKYLSTVKLDPYFLRLVKFLFDKNIKVVVLSDNFDYILKKILFDHNGIKKLKLYSNRLRVENNRIVPYFPFRSKNCDVCAHCKTKNLLTNVKKDGIVVYIGDGRSDICPSQYADVVFAKEDLLKHYIENKYTCFEYKNLKEVLDYFKRSFL